MRANFDAEAAANTAFFDDGPIEVGKFEADGAIAERANRDTGTANATIDPRIARCAVDLREAHVDFVQGDPRERLGGADIHALAAKDASLLFRVDVGRKRRIAAIPAVKRNARRRANFAAETTADASGDEGCIVLQGAGRANVIAFRPVLGGNQQPPETVRHCHCGDGCGPGEHSFEKVPALHDATLTVCSGGADGSRR